MKKYWRFQVGTVVAASVFAGVLFTSRTTVSQGEEKKAPPAVGESASDFELAGLDKTKVSLAKLAERGPVVVLVLRGYPGYQCPLCTKQVAQFVASAEKLKAAKAEVLLIYPGPGERLGDQAHQFLGEKKLPDNFHLLLDPDFGFTKAYQLRWDAPAETAYPSTFVIGKDRKVRFAKVSKTHGGRASVEEVLKALEK